MNKTKLGVSIGLVGAAVYASGLVTAIVTFFLVGYILLFESDEWLRKSAIKAVAIVIVFAMITSGIQIITSIFGVLYQLVGIRVPLGLDTILIRICSIAETVILISCTVAALGKGSVKIGFIDRLIDKYM